MIIPEELLKATELISISTSTAAKLLEARQSLQERCMSGDETWSAADWIKFYELMNDCMSDSNG